MDREDVVPVYNGMLRSHKKEWNNAICSNMDATWDYHTKWRESERPFDITYMWNLKYDTNELIYEIDSENKLTVPKGERGEGERN